MTISNNVYTQCDFCASNRQRVLIENECEIIIPTRKKLHYLRSSFVTGNVELPTVLFSCSCSKTGDVHANAVPAETAASDTEN